MRVFFLAVGDLKPRAVCHRLIVLVPLLHPASDHRFMEMMGEDVPFGASLCSRSIDGAPRGVRWDQKLNCTTF